MAKVDEFIKENARWLLVVLFSAGILYSEFQAFKSTEENYKKELGIVEERLGKKIKIIQDNENKIHDLEIRIVKLETKDEL